MSAKRVPTGICVILFVSSFTSITDVRFLLCAGCAHVCLLCRKTRLTAQPVPRMNSLRLTRAVE